MTVPLFDELAKNKNPCPAFDRYLREAQHHYESDADEIGSALVSLAVQMIEEALDETSKA